MDIDAVDKMYKHYRYRIRRWCRQYIYDRDLIEDALHEIFIAILKNQTQIEGDPTPWLITVTRRVCWQIAQQRERKTRMDVPISDHMRMCDPMMDTAAPPVQTELSERLSTMISTLPAREQQVIRMRYGLGGERTHTLQEIGYQYGIVRDMVRQIEEHALRALRHHPSAHALRAYICI